MQNTGQEFDGSDSGARPDEAVSWGKIRAGSEAVKVNSMPSLNGTKTDRRYRYMPMQHWYSQCSLLQPSLAMLHPLRHLEIQRGKHVYCTIVKVECTASVEVTIVIHLERKHVDGAKARITVSQGKDALSRTGSRSHRIIPQIETKASLHDDCLTKRKSRIAHTTKYPPYHPDARTPTTTSSYTTIRAY